MTGTGMARGASLSIARLGSSAWPEMRGGRGGSSSTAALGTPFNVFAGRLRASFSARARSFACSLASSARASCQLP